MVLSIGLANLAISADAPPVQTVLGDVKDSRTTGKHFAGLEVEIKLIGDGLDGAKSMRAVVKSAVDDTGRDLVDPEKTQRDFEKANQSGGQHLEATLKLKNPSRKASMIKELTGEVQLFVPKNDQEATVKVDTFQKTAGTPISSPTLKSAGIEVTFWTKEQFDAMKEKKKEEAKKESQDKLGQGLAQAFGDFFDGFMKVGFNDVALRIKDPNLRLAGVEFQDTAGKKLDDRGRSSMGGKEEQTVMYHFASRPPEATQLMIYVLTPKATIKAPFALANIVLP